MDELPITVVFDPRPTALLPIIISLMSPLADSFVLAPITIELLKDVTAADALVSTAALLPNTLLEFPVVLKN